jgi:hypothetical protein
MQLEHWLAPEVSLNFPAGQLTQLEEPVLN